MAADGFDPAWAYEAVGGLAGTLGVHPGFRRDGVEARPAMAAFAAFVDTFAVAVCAMGADKHHSPAYAFAVVGAGRASFYIASHRVEIIYDWQGDGEGSQANGSHPEGCATR